jgi:hypothetical protein
MSASSQCQSTPASSAKDVMADESLTVATPAPPATEERALMASVPPFLRCTTDDRSAGRWWTDGIGAGIMADLGMTPGSVMTKGAPPWLQKLTWQRPL